MQFESKFVSPSAPNAFTIEDLSFLVPDFYLKTSHLPSLCCFAAGERANITNISNITYILPFIFSGLQVPNLSGRFPRQAQVSPIKYGKTDTLYCLIYLKCGPSDLYVLLQ